MNSTIERASNFAQELNQLNENSYKKKAFNTYIQDLESS
jgi:hypothetical protein